MIYVRVGGWEKEILELRDQTITEQTNYQKSEWPTIQNARSEKASMTLQFEHRKPDKRVRTRNRETNGGVEKTDGGANARSELGRGHVGDPT